MCLDMAWVLSYRTFTNCCQEKVQLGVWSYEPPTKCSLGLLGRMNRELTIVMIIILQGRRTRKRGTSIDQFSLSIFQAGYSTDGPWTPNRLTLFQTATSSPSQLQSDSVIDISSWNVLLGWGRMGPTCNHIIYNWVWL